MTLKGKVATGIGATIVATSMWLGLHAPAEIKKDGKIPKDKISAMRFPKGMKVTGDPQTHRACHQIVFQHPDGTRETLAQHTIEKDLSGMTEEEIKALVIAHTQADLEEEGMACADGPPDIFPVALADIKRCDGCGVDCWATSCPATYIGPHCTLDGTTCVITFICCGSSGGCPVSCEQ